MTHKRIKLKPDPDTLPPPDQPVEFEPFALGREVRTFPAGQFDLLVKQLKPRLQPRTLAAARLVLVDKFTYKTAALVCQERQSFVRCAVIGVMHRLGFDGPMWYEHDPDQSVVFRRIPARYHERLREAVGQLISEWENEGAVRAFDGWGDSGPNRPDFDDS